MKILVTGGLGFIGSHTVVELVESGHEVVIVDNLVNSKIEVLDRLADLTGVKLPFYQVDVTDEAKVKGIFEARGCEGVIDGAGLKAVGEDVISVEWLGGGE